MVDITQAAAQQIAASAVPLDTAEILKPIIEGIQPVMGIISALVGGLFGLYLIFIISRLYYEHKKVKLMKDIRYDLDYLNQHFKLPYSKEKGIRKKIMPLAEFAELRKEKEEKKEEKAKEKEGRREEKEKVKEEKREEKIKEKNLEKTKKKKNQTQLKGKKIKLNSKHKKRGKK